MTKHVLLVFTSPVEGREDDYNAWYNDVHLGEVLTADGFVRAQRFKASEMMPSVTEHEYVAIYEIEDLDPKDAMKSLNGASGSFTMTDAIELKQSKMMLASQVSDLVEA
ncbi:MAG: hypothetical protein VX785_04730 [Actinomycetota bacterium]|nr:hypothetical protein [Acidimicrobiales bacterium]MEC8922343.1 hypothetical protein [Actinomycetota bacterium]MED5551993.1 hypothetical protein [Actinomycetota bacterium]MEE3140640.1 hypothetical protein [Actinomycetota bacterium]MEE3187612.1 hypothetical protein [Actinomycetota bacterium]|tara:strand:- start:570 stop:896 length:327 start_codon:yes stop_codon:yes gene_type:complete